MRDTENDITSPSTKGVVVAANVIVLPASTELGLADLPSITAAFSEADKRSSSVIVITSDGRSIGR